MRKSNVLAFLIVAAAIALPLLLFPRMIYCSYKSPFIIPIASGNVIVGFRDSYLDKMEQVERKHTGIDIEGQSGENVLASGNGLVAYIGPECEQDPGAQCRRRGPGHAPARFR